MSSLQLPTGRSSDEANVRSLLQEADRLNLKRGHDIVVNTGQRVVFVSPNGTRFSLTIDDTGALISTSL